MIFAPDRARAVLPRSPRSRTRGGKFTCARRRCLAAPAHNWSPRLNGQPFARTAGVCLC